MIQKYDIKVRRQMWDSTSFSYTAFVELADTQVRSVPNQTQEWVTDQEHEKNEQRVRDALYEKLYGKGGELNMKDKKGNNQGKCCGGDDGAVRDVIKSRTFDTNHSESDAKPQNFDSAPKKSASEVQPATTGKGPA